MVKLAELLKANGVTERDVDETLVARMDIQAEFEKNGDFHVVAKVNTTLGNEHLDDKLVAYFLTKEEADALAVELNESKEYGDVYARKMWYREADRIHREGR